MYSTSNIEQAQIKKETYGLCHATDAIQELFEGRIQHSFQKGRIVLSQVGKFGLSYFTRTQGARCQDHSPAFTHAAIPLIGTTRRPGIYTETQFRNIPELHQPEPECFLRISPKDTVAWGIGNGDLSRVESPEGNIVLKAKVTDEVAQGVILRAFGWGKPGDSGANVNLLTSDDERDPISCSTSNHKFRYRVSKESP